MTEEVKEKISEEQSCQTRTEKLQKVIENCEKSGCELKGNESDCLQDIYKNAKMGMVAIEVLRPFSQDRGFRNILMRQYTEYNTIAKEMEMYCTSHNVELNSNNMMNKIMLFITTAVNTLKDKSNSKLSEIMIQGINMGIISTTRIQNNLSDINSHNEFADRMMLTLQQNLEDLKLFL